MRERNDAFQKGGWLLCVCDKRRKT